MIVNNGKFKYMGRFKRYNFEYCCSAESSLTTKSPSIINKEKQKKKIIDWDKRFATDKERVLAAKQNKNSGIPALMESIIS